MKLFKAFGAAPPSSVMKSRRAMQAVI